MVNYNSLQGNNNDDDDEKDASPYSGVAFKAVERPHPGVIYEREVERPRPRIPLAAELLRQEVEKQTAEKDKKDSTKDDSPTLIRPRAHRDAAPVVAPIVELPKPNKQPEEQPELSDQPAGHASQAEAAQPEAEVVTHSVDNSSELPASDAAHHSAEVLSSEFGEQPEPAPAARPAAEQYHPAGEVFELPPESVQRPTPNAPINHVDTAANTLPPEPSVPEMTTPYVYGAEAPIVLNHEPLPPIHEYHASEAEPRPEETPPSPPPPSQPPVGFHEAAQPPLPERQPVQHIPERQHYGLHDTHAPEQFPDAPPRSRIPGLLTIALGLEYVNRKIADRRLERQIKRNAIKQYREQQASHGQLSGNQQQLAAEQQRQAADMRALEARQAAIRPEVAPATPLSAAASLAERSPIKAPVFEGSLSQRRVAYEQRAVTPLTATPEARQQQVEQEQERKEQALVMAATLEAQQQEQQRQQEHHREMRDAWRSYEVDEHNHEIVTARERGEAFYQEQKELVKDYAADNDDTATIAKAGLTSIVAGMHSQAHGAQASLPSGMVTPALPTGQPAPVDPQHHLAAGNDKKDNNFSNPLFILMIILIIAAYFTANMLF
jgi:hypothetical protein